jgi:hypothetical protein
MHARSTHMLLGAGRAGCVSQRKAGQLLHCMHVNLKVLSLSRIHGDLSVGLACGSDAVCVSLHMQ